MLVMSSTRYVPTAVNMIVLQGENGLYYYVYRSLYDECVILHDQYADMLPSYYKLLGVSDEHKKVCEKFAETVPEPLNILAPFLSLVTKCEEMTELVDMCGALSAMSMSLSFRRMMKVPAEIRRSVRFSLSVREEYRIQWDRFFLETPTYEQVSFSENATGARNCESTASGQIVEVDDEDFDIEPIDFGAIFSDEDADDDAEATEESTPVESVETQSESSAPSKQSAFDMLRGIR